MRSITSLTRKLPELLEAARARQVSYAAFLEQAFQAELDGRHARAPERRMRAARLPFAARLDRFDVRFQPNLSERVIRELARLAFLETATNGVVLGPPGVGKTHVACGRAVAALEAGHSALFVRLRTLVPRVVHVDHGEG